MTTRPFERPTLLTLGIVLTAIRSVGIFVFGSLAAVLGVGLGGLALFADPKELFPWAVALTAGVLVAVGLLLYYGFTLLACAGAWRASRPWLWTLIVLACLGLTHSGPLGIVIHAMTIVGCTQALGELTRLGVET